MFKVIFPQKCICHPEAEDPPTDLIFTLNPSSLEQNPPAPAPPKPQRPRTCRLKSHASFCPGLLWPWLHSLFAQLLPKCKLMLFDSHLLRADGRLYPFCLLESYLAFPWTLGTSRTPGPEKLRAQQGGSSACSKLYALERDKDAVNNYVSVSWGLGANQMYGFSSYKALYIKRLVRNRILL